MRVEASAALTDSGRIALNVLLSVSIGAGNCHADAEFLDHPPRSSTVGAQSAIRWTKQTLNHWYRTQAAVLDASLAYEFYGFGGPDAAEGLASHKEKRSPRFTGPTSE